MIQLFASGWLGGAMLWLAWATPVQAQTGTFNASETWTVTIAEQGGETPNFSKTYQGTATGTLTVSNGYYTLIDQTGLSSAVAKTFPNRPLRLANSDLLSRPDTWHKPGLNTNRVITGGSGGYEIDGSYPVVGFAGNYAIVQFTFFMVKVQLPVTDFAIPVVDGGISDVYVTTGSSLASLSGAGDEADDNVGFTASASSTSSLTLGPPPVLVAPKITTQPVSQTVLPGANASFSVNATGTQPLAFQWLHAGTNLFDGGEFAGSASSTLSITGVAAADAGSYSVVVSNGKGSATSVSAGLNIVVPIRVVVIGQGTISGVTNGQLVAIGQKVTPTATPGAGYVLTNWLVTVDGVTILSTNRAASFLMQPDLVLTAAFADVQKPVLTITAPTPNEIWTNAGFTVAGKVTDNGPGGAVWYQLNGGNWNLAGGWSNWTASVTLHPGTNTVAAYAVDAAGNASATISQKMVYVLSAPISLQVVGVGTISGATNGQVLQLGKTVTLTAKPGTGCILTNWLVTVNGAAVLSTNKVAPFQMQSNLVVTATFADVSKPAVNILSPTASTSPLTNGLVTVQAQATDKVGASTVEFYLNGQDFGPGWQQASGLWTRNLALSLGTNMVAVVATDVAYNLSVTNSVQLVYLNNQTNANAITLVEDWLTAWAPSPPGFDNSERQDTGILKATLAVPGLQAMSADTWSNLCLSLSFGGFACNEYLYQADVLSTNLASFYFTDFNDPSGNLACTEQLTVSRSGNTLLIVVRMGNATNQQFPASFVAGGYEGFPYNNYGSTPEFALMLQDGNSLDVYAGITNRVYLTTKGLGTISSFVGYPNVTGLQVTGAADFTPPTITITAPVNGQRWSNLVFNVTGTAHDNEQVSNVWVQVNTIGWQLASTGNHWTNWTASVILLPGTNTVQAFAADASGNVSFTNGVKVSRSLLPLTDERVSRLTPAIHTGDGSLGVSANRFGFDVSGSSGQIVVVEVSTDLVKWQPVQTNKLAGVPMHFSDAQWTKYPCRYYRVRSP